MNIDFSGNCRKLLDSCSIATHGGELFCRNCYARLFPINANPVSLHEKQEIVPKTNIRDTSPLETPTSDYFSDYCCCCCSEECPISNNKIVESVPDSTVCLLEKSRFRGGGEQEEVYHLERRDKCCERKNSTLGVITSITTVCNPLINSSSDGHSINRQQSASQRSGFLSQYF